MIKISHRLYIEIVSSVSPYKLNIEFNKVSYDIESKSLLELFRELKKLLNTSSNDFRAKKRLVLKLLKDHRSNKTLNVKPLK